MLGFGRQIEDTLTAAALLAMCLLPALELTLRFFFHTGIPGSSGYVQNLTLWAGFLGAVLASREGRHLPLFNGASLLPRRAGAFAGRLSAILSAAVGFGLFLASVDFVRVETESPATIGGWLPIWVVESILPISFALITLRFVIRAGGWREKAVTFLGMVLVAVAYSFLAQTQALLWLGIGGLVLAGFLGVPVFVVLGGLALLLFLAGGVPIASIPVETYRIIVSPTIPTLPLFTLAGYILAEGRASDRLVRLFRALFGWLPGGLPIAAALVCTFFTTFTGASGVTILALGGLLLPVLLQNGYRERFATGLLTTTGSLGLLFPPSLPVILYGVVAHVPIPDLFKAGVVPGILMLLAVLIFGFVAGIKSKASRRAFHAKEAALAVWQGKWEVLLPVVALVAVFGGFFTFIEAAAVTVVYVLVVETVIHREIHPVRDLPGILVKCSTLIGGVFVILGVAMGLTNYLVDAQVPMKAAAWVQTHIESKTLFLLALTLYLLIVGCLMDIFSATVVQVPLIAPIGEAFGMNPLHVGVVFLANLEVGYLTPPVGLNLILASYRFEKPLVEVLRDVAPFAVVLFLVVLLVTFVPVLTLGVLK